MTAAPAARRGRTLADLVHEVHVRESGSPSSPAVLFIHGGGPSGVMWRLHLEALASRFHCLAPDLPGFGRSHDLRAISLPRTADLIAAVIRDRTAEGRAHLVGLSYGGSVAFAVLGRHAVVVDRAVIDGAGPFTSRIDPFVVGGARLVAPLMDTEIARAGLRAVGLAGLGESLRGASPRAIRRAWAEGYIAPLSPGQLGAACPTLLVAGEHEGPVRASNAAFAAVMPCAEAWFVPGLGHAWFAWRSELHIRMVEAWLTDAPMPDGLVPEPPDPDAVARLRGLLGVSP